MSSTESLDKYSSADRSLQLCVRILDGLQPGDEVRPTPCSAYTVADLVAHLVRGVGLLATVGGGEIVTSEPAGDAIGSAAVADVAEQTIAVWRGRGLDGDIQLGSSSMPASIAVNIVTTELFVHAWDLATATGQTFDADPDLTDFVYDLALELITPTVRNGRNFADPVDVAADAGTLERLIAFTGRPV